MNKKLTIVTILLIAIFAFCLVGCGQKQTSEPTYYYEVKDGEKIEGEWIFVRDDLWQRSDGSYGVIKEENGSTVFYSAKGEKMFTAVVDKGLIALETNGQTVFYYENGTPKEESVVTIATVYALAQEKGYTGTLEELIEAFKGDSAYAIAKKNGYTGSEADWLKTLIGAKGEKGDKPVVEIVDGIWTVDGVSTGVAASGEKGDKGADGKGIESVVSSEKENGTEYVLTYTDGETFTFTVQNGKDGRGIKNIEKTATDPEKGTDIYTITMSDDTFYTFEVKNGKDATYDLTVGELYDFMKENGYEGTYTDFVAFFAPKEEKDLTPINDALRASVVVKGEAGAGSGYFYDVDIENGSGFIVTNYHVVYNENNGAVSEAIKVYLYGSVQSANDTTSAQEMGIDATFIGGSMELDVAVLKVENSDIVKNSIAKSVRFGDSDLLKVGQDIFVVGNANGEGISVTQGIVSVVSENIVLQSVDGTGYVSRRMIRTDSAISLGNSGGGMFDKDGVLIGMVGAKTIVSGAENMGYAIPVNHIKTVVKSVLKQYAQDPTAAHDFVRPLLGITLFVESTYAKMDGDDLYIEENIQIDAVSPTGLAQGKVLVGDFIRSIKINDEEKIIVRRMYHVIDNVMRTDVGDVVTMEVERTVDGETKIIELSFTVTEEAFK